jgi:hypothetical protein
MGFANAELLQATDWEKVKLNPRKAAPMHPKWIWDHDPETYTEDNFENAVLSMEKNDVPWHNDKSIPPNYPPGYEFDFWSIENIIEDKKNGRETSLGGGDWA